MQDILCAFAEAEAEKIIICDTLGIGHVRVESRPCSTGAAAAAIAERASAGAGAAGAGPPGSAAADALLPPAVTPPLQ